MPSVIELIKMLYSEEFFSTWKTTKDVKEKLNEKGFNFDDPLIGMSLINATKKGILSRRKVSGRYKYSQRQPPEIKIKESEIKELNMILSDLTAKKLGERFQQDIKELNISFTYDCGNSAAFILRKILEKAIFYALSTNGKGDLIKDKSDNSILGLEAMINLCSKEKIKGVPVLMSKTSKELLGFKFLGDAAAHDYLADIEVKDINHQLSYWTTAIKELISNLK